MKRTIGYLSLAMIVFLFSLLMLYIGFISPAKSADTSPFIRMTICTFICYASVSLFTRYIHPYSGLAGLDSANLNLFFTVAVISAVFVEFVTFGNATVEPYLAALAENSKNDTGKIFYTYIKYVFMGSQLLVAVRTFIHSAFLGLLKAIMKHAD